MLAILGQGAHAVGNIEQRAIESNGAIVERTLDASGRVLQRAEVGNRLQLAVLSRSPQTDGTVLLIARDVTGTLLEVVLGTGGGVTAVRRMDVAAR